jgi:hypothetical protein
MKFTIALLAALLCVVVARATDEHDNTAVAEENHRVKRWDIFGILKKVDSAKICKKIGDTIGWYCDDPVSRWLWKAYNWFRGVTDCNSFCKKVVKKSGGSCRDVNNYDTSSWCKRGQTCMCN